MLPNILYLDSASGPTFRLSCCSPLPKGVRSHGRLGCQPSIGDPLIRQETILRAVASGALVLIASAVVAGLYLRHLDAPTGAAAQQVRIVDGMSARSIGARLEAGGIVRSGRWFELRARWQGVAARLEAGNYSLDGAHTTGQILDDLLEAPLELVRVTIPEGRTRQQTAALLAVAGLADSARFVALTQHEDLIRELGITAATLEGYLFPETYLFPLDVTEEQIVRHMVAQFFDVFTDSHFARLSAIDLSLHQAVTLASIVELEAVAASERPLIAAIFLRRLGFKRRLESCATVEFALGEHRTHLTNEDLKVKSPYNTYLHRGLPPGPIGNPGAASLLATVQPVADTEFLYFVSRGDGTHVFSRTNAEHVVAKREIRRKARAAAALTRASGVN